MVKEERAQLDMKTKRVSEVADYPELIQFSFPMQQLIVSQIRDAMGRCASDKEVRMLDSSAPNCDCKFFRMYYLPCKHMFHADMMLDVGWITEEIWKMFADFSGESGYEVYVTRDRVEVEESEDVPGSSENLRFHAALDSARDVFWRLLA